MTKKVTLVDMDVATLKGQVNALMAMVERLNTVMNGSLQVDAIDADLEVNRLEHEEKIRDLDCVERRYGSYDTKLTLEGVNKKIDQHLALIDQHLALHEVEKTPTETYYQGLYPDGSDAPIRDGCKDEYAVGDGDFRCEHGNLVLETDDCPLCAGCAKMDKDNDRIAKLKRVGWFRDQEIEDLKARLLAIQKYASAAEKALIAKDEEITDLKAKNIVLQRYTEDEIVPKSPFGSKDIPEEWRYCWTCGQSFLSDVDSPPAKFCSTDGAALHSYSYQPHPFPERDEYDESYLDDEDEYDEDEYDEYENECDDNRARRYCWFCGKIEEYNVYDDAPKFCGECGKPMKTVKP